MWKSKITNNKFQAQKNDEHTYHFTIQELYPVDQTESINKVNHLSKVENNLNNQTIITTK